MTRRSWDRNSSARFVAWHPEWWVYAVAAVAWVVMVMRSLGSENGGGAADHESGPGEMAGMAGMAMPASADGFSAVWSAASGHWVLMVAAMMLPVVAPQVRTVALRSVWSRRQRSAAAFVVAYAVVWVVAGAALITVLAVLDVEPPGTRWLIATLLLAAVWQVSAPRRRFLRRCGSLRLREASGLPADLNCLRVGARAGGRCLVTCGPLMLSMVASHSLLLMAGLLGVMLSERSRGPDPVRRAGRPLEAWVIAGFAAVASIALVSS
ncbi:MAG: DUF2182 domain-containing protein [Marmoricola sp.]